MKLYIINSFSLLGFISHIADINKVLTLLLLASGILLNIKKYFEKRNRK